MLKYIGLGVLLLPLYSLLLTLYFSLKKMYNVRIFLLFNVVTMLVVMLFSLILLSMIIQYGQFLLVDINQWITIGTLNVRYTILIDYISVLMLFVVALVSSLVHVYSLEYMGGDPHHVKFMQYLTLFTLAMFILITAGNLIQMFIGWEGVGVCSFLLVNFWDTRVQANTSAIKAIIVNRVGDFGLVYGLILLWIEFGGIYDYGELFSILSSHGYMGSTMDYIVIFIFIGAVGKSAQIFLHVWLPDAMEGPTPVSALIHAATMVTAGIFLLIRLNSMLELSVLGLKLIMFFGGLTAFYAGSVGMVQMDVKKVIAYSTCSQLGFMCVACGLSVYDVALFHLAMHAFFKALLFLSAGSLIHAFFYDEQDLRRMGGVFNLLPFTYICFFIGSVSLMGFPFTAGFYSKDFILETLMVSGCPLVKFSLLCCFLAVFCTSFYSARLIYIVFFGSIKTVFHLSRKVHDASLYIVIPLIVLALLSIVGGYFFKEFMINLGVLQGRFGNWILLHEVIYENVSSNYFSSKLVYYDVEELYIFFKHFSLLVVFLALFIIGSVYIFYPTLFLVFRKNNYIRFIYRFLTKKWYFDILYSYIIREYIISFVYSYLFLRWDRGFLEYFGPYGLTIIASHSSKVLSKFYNGSLEFYLSFFISMFYYLFLFLCCFLTCNVIFFLVDL